jgi:hypothetical protein
MNKLDLIIGCERVARDLASCDNGNRSDGGQREEVSEELRFAIQEHLSYTQMVIERYLAQVPIVERENERMRIESFTPVVCELRRLFLNAVGRKSR